MSYIYFGTTVHKIPDCYAKLGIFPKRESMFWHWIPLKKVILSAGNYNIDELCAICTLDMLNEYHLSECFKELCNDLKNKVKNTDCPMCNNLSAYFAQVSYSSRQTTYGPLFYTGEFADIMRAI